MSGWKKILIRTCFLAALLIVLGGCGEGGGTEVGNPPQPTEHRFPAAAPIRPEIPTADAPLLDTPLPTPEGAMLTTDPGE